MACKGDQRGENWVRGYEVRLATSTRPAVGTIGKHLGGGGGGGVGGGGEKENQELSRSGCWSEKKGLLTKIEPVNFLEEKMERHSIHWERNKENAGKGGNRLPWTEGSFRRCDKVVNYRKFERRSSAGETIPIAPKRLRERKRDYGN